MKRFISLTISILAAAVSLNAQNVSDLIISEVMPAGEGTVVDGFGRHAGWIEVYNTSYGTVDIGGCFFTDDITDLTKSPVPRKDIRTKTSPRQAVLFHEAGDGASGTFHLNFEILPGKTVYLVSNNGRDIIDSFAIPCDIPEGMSASKVSTDSKGMVFSDPAVMKPSPMKAETRQETRSKSDEIKEKDPHGFVLTVVCVAVVFSALAILFLIYNLLGMFFTGKFKRKSSPAPSGSGMTPEEAAAVAMALDMEMSGETEAAICTALHLYLSEESHDSESFIITIRPHKTAWNDKHQISRKLPRK